jgi:hypothetical protein
VATLPSTLGASRRLNDTSAFTVDPDERRIRRRGNWQVLAWAFFTVETMGQAFAAHTRINGLADDLDGRGTGGNAPVDGAITVDDLDETSLADDGAGASSDGGIGGAFLGAGPMVTLAAAAGPFGAAHSVGTSVGFGSLFGLAGGGARGGSGAGGTSGNPGGGTGGGEVAFNPSIEFFGGFDPFAEALGFGNGFHAIAELTPGGLGGLVGAALNVSDSPLAPLSFWTQIGGFSATHQFSRGDRFEAEYTVQATGLTDQGLHHAQGATGVNDGQLVQYGSLAEKTLANQATLVDGQDWDGALIVYGNYYEFNTIVQINITWNNDTVTVTRVSGPGFAGGAQEGPGRIDVGGNEQTNLAQIIEYATRGEDGEVSGPDGAPYELTYADYTLARVEDGVREGAKPSPLETTAPAATGVGFDDDADPVAQVFAGGIVKHNAVIQQSVAVSDDTLIFAIEDILNGNTGAVNIAGFADVDLAGHVQHNGSLIATRDGSVAAMQTMSKEDFLAQFAQAAAKPKVEIVGGDYYEFNTIFQINIMDDGETISHTIGGPAGASQYGWGPSNDVLATGGNMQFNAASLVKNDAHDYLYVGGRYTQYNLVLQVNALDNSSVVNQISAVVHDGGEADGPGRYGVGPRQDDDGDGWHGGTYTHHLPDHLLPT